MKTNHTKDKLTPDLVSIDDTKPTKNEQREVRGMEREFIEDVLVFESNTYEARKEAIKSERDRLREIALDNLKSDIKLILQHLQEQHEAEKLELVEEILEAKFTQVGSVNAWVTTDEIEAIAQRHGLSTKE